MPITATRSLRPAAACRAAAARPCLDDATGWFWPAAGVGLGPDRPAANLLPTRPLVQRLVIGASLSAEENQPAQPHVTHHVLQSASHPGQPVHRQQHPEEAERAGGCDRD